MSAAGTDIVNKFGDLVWLERQRIAQAMRNPAPDFRWARVQGPHLKTLDRYMNIQPWQNHRIKLRVPEGHVDYINASPITLTPSPRPATDSHPGESREPDRYIAMQGPKPASIDHVWRMVVEQLESPGVIIMLTETHDGHIEKCSPYFPRSKDDPPLEINERDEFGDGFRATVRCEGLEETPAGDAIELRKLVIRVHGRGAARSRTETMVPTVMATTDDDREEEGEEDEENDVVVVDDDSASTSDAGVHSDQQDAVDVKMKSHCEDSSEPAESAELASAEHTTTAQGDTAPTQPEDGDASATDEEERVVWHFLYKKWPDFGVPSISDLESFFTLMRLSREKNAGPHNPRIVHCSAGVGRSGTFIALEHLIRELDAGVLEHYDERASAPTRSSTERSAGGEDESGAETSSPATTVVEEGEDLIFSTVNELREQRRNMVQAEGQYIFIYQVLRKLWQDKYGSSTGEGGEPAAKRLEVDPFMEQRQSSQS